MDGAEPVRPEPVIRLADAHEERRAARAAHLGMGTLACPRCDVPVTVGRAALRPADDLGCPFCGHTAAARDFLSLTAPARPARVLVRVVARRRPGR